MQVGPGVALRGGMTASRQLARIVQLARRHRGWSQADLAEAAGVSDETISRIERGAVDPSLVTAAALAEALELSLDTLAGRTRWPAVAREPSEPEPPHVEELARLARRLGPAARRTLVALAKLLVRAPERAAPGKPKRRAGTP